jgi:hypothetical protein
MNMIGDSAYTEAFATKIPCNCGEIGVKFRAHFGVDQGASVPGAEDDMDQQKYERLRHGEILARAFGPLFVSGSLAQAFGLG